MIVPPNSKIPLLEQRKKRGFCKYQGFLGHKTSQCFLFRDLIQNAIKDGRLKFADKGKNNMKVNADPLNVADTNYVEPVDINMVDVFEADITECEMVSARKHATESLSNNVIFNTEVEGSLESKTTEGLMEKTSEATEDPRMKLQKIRISEVPPAGVNMVNVGQP